jgi:hypothetical protein
MISRSISLLPVVQASCRRCLASLSLSQRHFSKLPLFATTRLITVHEYHSNKKRTCVQTRRSHSHELIQEYSHQDSEDPQELCKNFLTHICDDIKKELNSELVPLRDLSHYLFDGKGKYIRPQIVFLFAVACNKTVQSGRRLVHFETKFDYQNSNLVDLLTYFHKSSSLRGTWLNHRWGRTPYKFQGFFKWVFWGFFFKLNLKNTSLFVCFSSKICLFVELTRKEQGFYQIFTRILFLLVHIY